MSSSPLLLSAKPRNVFTEEIHTIPAASKSPSSPPSPPASDCQTGRHLQTSFAGLLQEVRGPRLARSAGAAGPPDALPGHADRGPEDLEAECQRGGE